MDESHGKGSAGVYYPAAIALAANFPPRAGDIVGAAIAHEVGHLILGAAAHSSRGVMKGRWGAEQFRLIGISELNFTREHGKLLREATQALEALTADGL